jgi:hypothetical protein
MLSREARVALLTVTASIKYGAAIKETATLLDWAHRVIPSSYSN